MKSIFFDFDGTLRCSKGPYDFPVQPDDVEILPGRREKLARCRQLGYLLLGVSNQSAIHKGLLTTDVAVACFKRTNELLGQEIDFRFCPHQSQPVICKCRKPDTLLGLELIQKHNLDVTQCLFVGNADSDREFANRLGLRYFDATEFFTDQNDKMLV